MSNFNDVKVAVDKQLEIMGEGNLFFVAVSKDELWNTYLNAFKPGTNPIYRERTQHDCQCCKQFIRTIGNVVSINDGKVSTIWDVEVGGNYQIVVDILAKLVRKNEILGRFFHYNQLVGTDHNFKDDDGNIKRWDHFCHVLNQSHVMPKDHIPSFLSKVKSDFDVFKRGLIEFSASSIEVILDLISDSNLYRGEENKVIIEDFLKHKKASEDAPYIDIYCWENLSHVMNPKFRNTAIGELLIEINAGRDLESAVISYEKITAPEFYKRPKAVVTKKMTENAKKKAISLGIENSFSRRHATIDDITINNVIFANRSAKNTFDVFDSIEVDDTVDVNRFSRVKSIDLKSFIEDVLPRSESIEILFEDKHSNNLMSLVAPANPDAKFIFQWDNAFSWSYYGEVTDSIKEKVISAGGDVDAFVRYSIHWFNYDDLDAHIIEPNNNHIYHGHKHSLFSDGTLNVDMNIQAKTRKAVENIIFPSHAKMLPGKHRLYVKNFTHREDIDIGFDAEIESGGRIWRFKYRKELAQKEIVNVAYIDRTDKGIIVNPILPLSNPNDKIWGISTNKFHNVKVIMNSPNHWDGSRTGNKHVFFIIEDCMNDKLVRGFYNEFLRGDLREHRKVFELLGSSMKAPVSDDQLSGLGFSTTKSDSFYVRVKGHTDRLIKVVV